MSWKEDLSKIRFSFTSLIAGHYTEVVRGSFSCSKTVVVIKKI